MGLIESVASVCDCVRKKYHDDIFPREALEMLIKIGGCKRCALFSVTFKNTYIHSLSAIHVVPDYMAEVPRREREAFEATVPHFKENQEATCLILNDGEGTVAHFAIRMHDGRLTAVLSCLLRAGRKPERYGEFVKACIPAFSLWFEGQNQRKTMQDIYNFTREPLYIMNTDGVLVMWNQAMSEISGCDSKEMLGKGGFLNAVPFYGEKRLTVPHLIIDPDPVFEKRNYVEFRREGDVIHAVTFLPSVPGGGAYVSCKTQRLYDINGMLYAAIHSLRDLTQMRQLETDLHKLRFIGRMANDLSENGIVLFNQEGVSYYNDNMLKILDLPPHSSLLLKDILGLAALTSKEDREKVIAFNRQVLRSEEPSPPFVEFILYKDNDNRCLRCQAHVDPNEEATVMLSFTDVTRERTLVSQAKENEMKVMRADRLSSLGILSAGIAHEIAQPLGTIKVLVDSFLFGQDQGWQTDQQSIVDTFGQIGKQVDRMSQIVDGIRIFSRDESEITPGYCDVNTAVRNVMDIIERQFEAKGIKMTLACCAQPMTVNCGLSHMEQVIMNLVLNSRQSLEGCMDNPFKAISVVTECSNGVARVRIKDNGTGIAAENIQRIFDPFFTTKEIGQGTGLGLSICKAIINEARGDIEVWNNPSRGCTFQCYLPILENIHEGSAD